LEGFWSCAVCSKGITEGLARGELLRSSMQYSKDFRTATIATEDEIGLRIFLFKSQCFSKLWNYALTAKRSRRRSGAKLGHLQYPGLYYDYPPEYAPTGALPRPSPTVSLFLQAQLLPPVSRLLLLSLLPLFLLGFRFFQCHCALYFRPNLGHLGRRFV
jgi:hypothetical protein